MRKKKRLNKKEWYRLRRKIKWGEQKWNRIDKVKMELGKWIK